MIRSFGLTVFGALAVSAALAAPGLAQNAGGPTTAVAGPSTAPPNDYAQAATWLCRPDHLGPCGGDLTTTVIAPDGKTRVEPYHAAKDPKIDCFYVYPTVSHDPTPNSDMNAGPEENNVVLTQFARLGAKCRLFAPLYRQVTLTALRAGIAGKPMTVGPGAGLQRREGAPGTTTSPTTTTAAASSWSATARAPAC